MLWSKQPLMKYLPFCERLRPYVCLWMQSAGSSGVTPTHALAYKAPGAPQKAGGVSASRHRAIGVAKWSVRSGRVLLLNESHIYLLTYTSRGTCTQSHTQTNCHGLAASESSREKNRKHPNLFIFLFCTRHWFFNLFKFNTVLSSVDKEPSVCVWNYCDCALRIKA